MVNWAGDLAWKAYEVQTADGYNLSLFRITDPSIANAGSKGPLLLIHGLGTDSITWFERSDDTALATPAQLALEGYDVWLANTRGTKYSRTHLSQDAGYDNDVYWNFDFNRVAENDIEAMVKEIFEVN